MTPNQLRRQIGEAIARTAKVGESPEEGLLLVEADDGNRFIVTVERLAGTIAWPERESQGGTP